MRGVFFLSKVVRILVLSLCLICMASIASASSFRLGDQGNEIAEIQAALASQGYDVTADGDLVQQLKQLFKHFKVLMVLTMMV